MEYLSYSILMFDESNCNFTLIYQSRDIFDIINHYNYFLHKYKNSYFKVVRDLQIYEGV